MDSAASFIDTAFGVLNSVRMAKNALQKFRMPPEVWAYLRQLAKQAPGLGNK